MRFSSYRQSVQYENIVGKKGERDAYGSYWDGDTTYSDHWSRQPYKQGANEKIIVGRKLVRGIWLVIRGDLKMPDGQEFPDNKFKGVYMWAIPESKESDGMPDALKRYRPKGFRPINDQELAEALASAARAFQRKLEYDMFSGSAPS